MRSFHRLFDSLVVCFRILQIQRNTWFLQGDLTEYPPDRIIGCRMSECLILNKTRILSFLRGSYLIGFVQTSTKIVIWVETRPVFFVCLIRIQKLIFSVELRCVIRNFVFKIFTRLSRPLIYFRLRNVSARRLTRRSFEVSLLDFWSFEEKVFNETWNDSKKILSNIFSTLIFV